MVLLATVLGSTMALLDSTVVNVALPHIGDDLDADLQQLQWVVTGYVLTLASLILVGGSLSDRLGRRRVFTVGIVWFALASLLCGIAPNAPLLIGARALQGVGGALLTPGSLALIQAVFHPDDRARAVGVWSGLGGVGAAVGPFLGGWLVDGPGWRWVFLLNLPVAAVCVPLARRYVPETRAAGEPPGSDVAGAVLGVLALGLVTYAFIDTDWLTGVLGVLAGAAFVRTERRSRAPMLPPSLFASRTFTVINVVTLFVYAALTGFFFVIALQLQVVSGYSALAAGTAMLPTTVLMLLLSGRSGALGARIGPRLPLTAGCLLAAGGVLLLLRAGPGAAYLTDVLPGMALLGMGLVALVAPLTSTVLAYAPEDRSGIASGVNNAIARAAGLLAVAALPLLTGMGPEVYRQPARFDAAFDRSVVWCAAAFAVAAALSWLLLRVPPAPAPVRPECRTHCALTAPPLDPGRQRPKAQ
ncbi:MFS transporter [Streptomyces sp. NPDC047097]|uniref:MFS transporter n=1 Tax=Streptomyces sp. NPDC047097 TaxID=3155260 RepID=UPI0033F678EB